MTETHGGWLPPERTTPAPDEGAVASLVPSVPLGGVRPSAPAEAPRVSRRDLVVATLLLVAAVLAGAASLMPWRDYGRVVGPAVTETGWMLPDGSLGRGWVAVLLGVIVAVAGVLIAADRERPGRILAVTTGVLLMLFAIGEWGLGAGRVRSGPGSGLWLLFGVGLAVVIAVGVIGPSSPSAEPSS